MTPTKVCSIALLRTGLAWAFEQGFAGLVFATAGALVSLQAI